jgi:Na+/H+-dicarboxylate symporter
MAEIRAATNLASNIIATLVVTRWAGAVDLAQANDVRSGGERSPAPSLATAGD